jgi:putative nucleotidyltransferase with HDIG domain
MLHWKKCDRRSFAGSSRTRNKVLFLGVGGGFTAIPLEEIVRGVNDLPSLPWVVGEVIKLIDDPNSTISELNEVICRDQSMTTKVLRLSNSAFYGYSRRIATIVEAIGVLGYNTIRDLVLAASVYSLMKKEVKGYQIASGDIWRHSITCAMTARIVARRTGYQQGDQAFIAGLVHDIGKVILSVYVADAYDEIIRQVREEEKPFSVVEEEILGFTHAAVGARVADKWNLPADHVEAIACHHTPLDAAENPELTAIVHVADAICMSMGIGLGGDGLYYPFEGEALALLRLNEKDVEAIISELSELVSDESIFQLGK